jgi:hypothetical protein
MGPAMLEQTISLWQRLSGLRLGFQKQRESEREESDFWVWFTPASQPAVDSSPEIEPKSRRCPALVQNISHGGLNLIVQGHLETGALLKVEPEEDQSVNAPFLWVRVVHVVPDGEGAFILGCIFPFELSEEELKSFGGQRLKSLKQDYRAWVRFPCDAKAICKPAPAEPGEWQAQIVNVSPSGIGLIVTKSFQPGAMLNIALPASSNQKFRTVLACVVHLSPQGEGRWSVGCSFATELTDEDLQCFGVSRDKSKVEDCRTWVRSPCGLEKSYTSIGSRDEDHCPARVLNISPNGIGLQVCRPVEPGALLQIDLYWLNETLSKSLLACVVYVKELEAGEWILGCTFASDLSLED